MGKGAPKVASLLDAGGKPAEVFGEFRQIEQPRKNGAGRHVAGRSELFDHKTVRVDFGRLHGIKPERHNGSTFSAVDGGNGRLRVVKVHCDDVRIGFLPPVAAHARDRLLALRPLDRRGDDDEAPERRILGALHEDVGKVRIIEIDQHVVVKAPDAPGVKEYEHQARQHDHKHHEEHHADEPGSGRGRLLEVREVVRAHGNDGVKIGHRWQPADARNDAVGVVKEILDGGGAVGKPRALPARPVRGAEAPDQETRDEAQGKGNGRKVQHARYVKPHERRGKHAPAGVEGRFEALFKA